MIAENKQKFTFDYEWDMLFDERISILYSISYLPYDATKEI